LRLRLRARLLLRPRLRCGPCLRLRLRLCRTYLRLGGPCLRLRLRLCRTCLRLGRPCLRLRLRLCRTYLRLGRPCLRLRLRLCRTYLRLGGPCLRLRLRLCRTYLRLLGGPCLRLRLRLCRTCLRLNRTRLRLCGTGLRLDRSGLGLARAICRLPRAYRWLAGTDWLHLRSALRLTGTVAGLDAWVGALDAGLRRDGTCSDNNGRTALILAVELLAVLSSLALILKLGRHGGSARSPHGRQFRRLWPYCDSAVAAVVGDAAVVVVDDDCAVVDVGDVDVDAVHGTVVVEVISVPVAAMVAAACVAEAVVDATVEADVRAPEAAVETVSPPIKAPVTRGPESAIIGWSAPGAGDPVVACGGPSPVAWGPEIVGRGGHGLLVDGQRRRRLVGVFDRLASIGIGVQLVVVLSVLIGWVGLIWWRRSLLLGVLLGALLGRGLRACP
jgi:hypothetical protein